MWWRPRAKQYLLTYGWPRIDTWGHGEAVCYGEHPIQWVARLRGSGTPGARLMHWQEITAEEARLFELLLPEETRLRPIP